MVRQEQIVSRLTGTFGSISKFDFSEQGIVAGLRSEKIPWLRNHESEELHVFHNGYAITQSRRCVPDRVTTPDNIFTPADLSDDQRLIGQTAEEFVAKEVVPSSPSSSNTKKA